ncbi:MAG: GNAT family N-acetyltransferase [Phycisphaerae bacterium]|jgi:ribosomal protein S18 acetylase RimI-like enzyme|nr:GNAT family N-acetyltransferase [Phycisphaerae bacterium]
MMGAIELSFDRPITGKQLIKLMAQTTWGRQRTVAELDCMIAGTTHTLGAWDGERLVGFLRALSDGRFRSFIEDFVVDAPCRRRGIGSRMMTMMLERLSGVEDVYLFTGGDALLEYYQSFGFIMTPFHSMLRRPGERGGA